MAAPSDEVDDGVVYGLVSNIPKEYRSADLRNFFNEFVEQECFTCFHFRHRPALRRKASVVKNAVDVKMTCCVIKMEYSQFADFIKWYHGKYWVNVAGKTTPHRCFITKIKCAELQGQSEGDQQSSSQDVVMTRSELLALPELNPPKLMPNGNTGTPTAYFLERIRECRIPTIVVKRLGISFSGNHQKGIYGTVSFDYGQTIQKGAATKKDVDSNDDDVRTGSGHRLLNHYIPAVDHVETNEQKDGTYDIPESEEEDDGECEEWDRHEALHDDVTEQGRNKERLFEEEIELKWEKGGSGLVFYTDAQYWDEEKGDFDERTTDDWDVDFSVYYEKGGGDMDARDSVQMRREKRLRDGCVSKSAFKKHIGRFERHTKGIGRRLMEQSGWTDGMGLGKSAGGIAEALENEGKHPFDRKGFGYHGEKLIRFPAKKRRKDIMISTIYDDPDAADPHEKLLRSNPTTTLKHRTGAQKPPEVVRTLQKET